MTEETLVWLKKAEEDWLTAIWLLDEKSPVTTPALFHLQQCAEKLLKGYLTGRGRSFERRHDLSYLLSLAEEPELTAHADLLDELTPFAVEIRYPGDSPAFTRSEALILQERVGQFRANLISRLS